MTDTPTAIVTGGGSGIGEALSMKLAHRGARVVVADIDEDAAQRVAATITGSGGRATASRVDVTREQDITRLVNETAAEYGHLDYQFNNAGIAIAGDARDLTLDQWRRVLAVDLYGVLYGTLAAYPIMASRGSGHIVNISSGAGLVPGPLIAPYCTAKHGVVGLSLSLRLEGADLGVKVSVVCPGWVRTKIFETAEMVNLPQERAYQTTGRIKMLEAERAARAIMDGVARNRALIAFPGYVRLAWRVTCLFPRLLDRTGRRRVQETRKYRTPHGDGWIPGVPSP
ncbi:MAG: SDR family oxidoreductase [Streptosporangiaceae bacterium]|nr:SDR family oxidoreductase [Streptosporangiaceae bacterium]